jgi:hypothetical protein
MRRSRSFYNSEGVLEAQLLSDRHRRIPQILGFGLQADFKIDLQIDPHIGPYEALGINSTQLIAKYSMYLRVLVLDALLVGKQNEPHHTPPNFVLPTMPYV